MTTFDPDLLGSASYRNMIANTSGPLRTGATETVLTLDGNAAVDVTWATREPLVIVLSRNPVPLDVTLSATLGDHSAASFGTIHFATFTEQGAALPIHRPAVDALTRMAAPFSLALSASLLKADGTRDRDLTAAEIEDAFEVRVVEGVLGRVLYALGAEKARIRREAIQIAAMRELRFARREALDRIGREVGVPRFTDVLSYDDTTKQIVAGLGSRGAPVMESDDDYRRRLAIYRRSFQATPQRVRDALNGPGAPSDPNAGLISGLGFTKRFVFDESDEALAMTIHLIETGPVTYRANFTAYIRTNFLVWLEDSPAATAAHDSRFLPRSRATEVSDLRARLRGHYTFPAAAAVAPALAESLDRFAALRALLGGPGTIEITRAQDATGGNRFELGLGVAITPPSAAELDALAARAADPGRPRGSVSEEALLRGTTPKSAADDPDGAWLLSACGVQTVHRIDSTTLYLSHLPVYGLVIDGATQAPEGADVGLDARYLAPGDPGGNASLLAGLSTALGRWKAAGHAAWTRLSDLDAHTAWQSAPTHAQVDKPLGIFRAAGLVAIEQPAPVVAQLLGLPAEYLTTIKLDAVLSAAIIAGDTAAATTLEQLVSVLRDTGLASVVALIDSANEVVLVVSVVGLPLAGLNLNERRTSGFRWYVVPISGAAGSIQGVGSHTVYHSNGPGLSAIVTIGYARQGRTDPYEYRVDLPDGAVLSIKQYEFLMNLLQATYPVGVMINTFFIRSKHVDLDGDGKPEPLLPAQARTYRQYRRARYRGEAAIGLDAQDQGL